MEVNDDFVDIVRSFSAHRVDFLIVGAYALAAHGFPRATGDIDLLVRPTAENARKVMTALIEFGAPLAAHQVVEDDFARPDHVYQMGLPPRRIDLLTSISGVSFDDACVETLVGTLGSVPVRFIGRSALLRNKLASGRPRDLADAALLREQLR